MGKQPDYGDEAPSLDVLILGAYYADSGQRAGMLSRFLLGVIDHTPGPQITGGTTTGGGGRSSMGPLGLLGEDEDDEIIGGGGGHLPSFYTIGRCGSGT